MELRFRDGPNGGWPQALKMMPVVDEHTAGSVSP
jgi:hypothetical protein